MVPPELSTSPIFAPIYLHFYQKPFLRPGSGSCRCWGASKGEGERKGESAGDDDEDICHHDEEDSDVVDAVDK